MDGYIKIGTEIDATSFDAQIEYIESQLEEIEHKIKQADMGFEVGDTQKLEAQYEKLINQLTKLRQKQADLGKVDLSGVKKSVDKISDSVSNVLKKVTRWGLAIIGIRTAYNGVRNAISLVSSKNEEIASQFEVMKNTIANTLLPVVQQIVSWLAKIMIYINYIVKALTGKTLFDFDKAFEDAKNNANKTEKSVKEIRKQLAGFDEMNVLSDTKGGGVTAGGVTTPTLTNPFENWQEVEIPDWVDKIVEFGKWVLENWEQVVGLLLLSKLVIDLFTGNWIGVLLDFIGYVILAIPQIIEAVQNIWSILTDIGAWLVGVLIDSVKSVVVSIGTEIAKIIIFVTNLWDVIKTIFRLIGEFVGNVFNGIMNIAKNVVNNIISFFKNLPKNISTIFNNIVNGIKSAFSTIVSWVNKYVVQPISDLFEGMMKGLENIFTGIKNTIIGIVNVFIKAINGVIKGLNKIRVDIPDWVPGFGGQKWGFNLKEVKEIKLAKGGIINNPGRGVPLASNVTGGEVAREGVIPLTDSQMMEQLGATIGKYITVNANITNTMNGRVISRELKKIQSADDFAFNG
jgi:hypothetical protein